MKEYQNYLFDLYGTLVDVHTDEDNMLLWQRMSILLGIEGISAEPLILKERYFSGVSKREAGARKLRGKDAEIDIASIFASFYEDAGIHPSNEDVARLAKIFRLLSLEKLRLFPGVPELMKRLKEQGKGIYLLSNAQALFTLPEISALGLEALFDGILLSSCEGYKKPSKLFYEIALERFHLDPEETVMIGNDDQADCWGASNAGLDSMYIFTEQSPKRTKPLPENCRELECIGDVFKCHKG